MSYISTEFLFFVVLCFSVYYLVPKKIRQYVLLTASIVFYFLFSKYLIVASVSVAAVIYFISLKIGAIDESFALKKKELSKEERKAEKEKIKKKKKKLVAVECTVAFALLVVFKYLGFLTNTINSFLLLFSEYKIPVLALLMPIGISYYTLSIVGYAVEVYRGSIKPEKNFASLYLFTIYFPHIIEGPIGKYNEFSKQLSSLSRISYEEFMSAVELILLGLVKKMIVADRAGIICSTYFDDYSKYGAFVTILNIALYTINIYFDFSGCMDIVMGVSELFGIRLPENFRQPFFSKNVQEFWRRWHISLGDWIKKYIFFSVSMSKINQKVLKKCRGIKSAYFQNSLPMLFALLFVWLFNGIWHGSGWKYIAYGMYYYAILSLGILFEPTVEKICNKLSINRESKVYHTFQICRTTVLVMVGLTLFKADTVKAFVSILKSLTKLVNPISDFISFKDQISLSLLDFAVIAIFTAVLLLISIKKEKGIDIQAKLQNKKVVRWVICTLAILCILMLGIYGPAYSEQPFVYAQF